MSAARRAMVEVHCAHPVPVRRAVMEPGRVLRVGRTELADLRVPGERWMSGVHFELSWDGASCRVRDRRGAGGTWLDGQPVSEGEVKSGGWIRAGSTLFLVFLEGVTEVPGPADPPEIAARKERALGALRTETAPLFALLDAARDRRILELLRGSVEEHRSLYDGLTGEALTWVAPHLVSLPRDGELLERLVREGWGASWGVYLTSERSFAETRRCCRRLLKVDVEEPGERLRRLYLRFYDPRVLRELLPMCTARQRAEMFEGIGQYVTEGEDGEVILHRAG